MLTQPQFSYQIENASNNFPLKGFVLCLCFSGEHKIKQACPASCPIPVMDSSSWIPDVQNENTAVRLSAAVNIPFKWKGVDHPLPKVIQRYCDRMKYFKRVEMGMILPWSATATEHLPSQYASSWC